MALIVKGLWFWGEFEVNNERKRINLGVRVAGTVPKPLNSPGDAAFERSRGKALAAYADQKADLTDPTRAALRLEKIHHLSTGHKIRATPLGELHAVWEKAPRKRDVMSCQHKGEVKKLIDELIAFAKGRNSQVDEARCERRAGNRLFLAVRNALLLRWIFFPLKRVKLFFRGWVFFPVRLGI